MINSNKAKVLEQLQSGFKKTITWNRYQYLDYLIDLSFQEVNRIFVLSFEDKVNRTSYKRYFLPTIEIKDYNVIIDGQIFFDQSIKNDLRTNDSIRKLQIVSSKNIKQWLIILQ